ncbi:MAG: 23S rRNA (adenine(2503)-C(2))-methyltransferase RlmN [Thermoleophilia bacterium]|nr:23S rRNA (adenine(2503)-C(2))-methyltransferase RlmN [Thermoleophilia bacterium]
MHHLIEHPLQSFTTATVLPAALRAELEQLGDSTLTLVDSLNAPDGTTKLLLRCRDDSHIETVIMRYRRRITLCVSSQVGCPVGCAFCATGAMGFRRNLTTAEIVDQVRVAAHVLSVEGRRPSNVVFMGMGEPLLNLQAVLNAIELLTNPAGLGLAHRAIAVSTVGIPAGIRRLARVQPQIHLALSLHAPDERVRAQLVPPKFRHSIPEILAAADEHFALTHRKLFVEYVLMAGINDSPEQARKLAILLKGRVVTVNLLAWNEVPELRAAGRQTFPSSSAPLAAPSAFTRDKVLGGRIIRLRPPSPSAIARFRDILLAAGVETVVRASKGESIRAACGQLAGRQ